MLRKKKAGKQYNADELVEIYKRMNLGESSMKVSKDLGRTKAGVQGTYNTMNSVLRGKPWAVEKCTNPEWKKAVDRIKQPGEAEAPPVGVTNQEYSNVTVERMQDELADNIDGFRKYLIDWAVGMVDVLDQDRQALLHKLTAENKKLKEELDLLQPVVREAQKDSTRSMLEKKLNQFSVRRTQ